MPPVELDDTTIQPEQIPENHGLQFVISLAIGAVIVMLLMMML